MTRVEAFRYLVLKAEQSKLYFGVRGKPPEPVMAAHGSREEAEEFQEIFGTGWVYQNRFGKTAEAWTWNVYGEPLYPIVKELLPMLTHTVKFEYASEIKHKLYIMIKSRNENHPHR